MLLIRGRGQSLFKAKKFSLVQRHSYDFLSLPSAVPVHTKYSSFSSFNSSLTKKRLDWTKKSIKNLICQAYVSRVLGHLYYYTDETKGDMPRCLLWQSWSLPPCISVISPSFHDIGPKNDSIYLYIFIITAVSNNYQSDHFYMPEYI